MVTNSLQTGCVTLRIEQLERIEEALVIGLQLLGEWQERDNTAQLLLRCKDPFPKELTPIDVTGTSDTVTVFADALLYAQLAKKPRVNMETAGAQA